MDFTNIDWTKLKTIEPKDWFGSVDAKTKISAVNSFGCGAKLPDYIWMKFVFVEAGATDTTTLEVRVNASGKQQVYKNGNAINGSVVISQRFVFSLRPWRAVVEFKLDHRYRFDGYIPVSDVKNLEAYFGDFAKLFNGK
jgi:hypothetical protein